MGMCSSMFFQPLAESIPEPLKYTEPMSTRYIIHNNKTMVEIKYNTNNIDHVNAITDYLESKMENTRIK